MRTRPLHYSAALLAVVSVACTTDVAQPTSPAAFDVSILQEGADLAITKEANDRNAKIGENITFTITVTNLGPSAATGVVFGDPLPDPLNLVSFSCSDGAVSGQSFCAVASLASGASASATLVATPIANPARSERRFTNTAFISASDVEDPNSSNNTATVKLHIVGKTP